MATVIGPIEGGESANGSMEERTYVRKFLVESTTSDGAYNASTAPGLPLIGNVHHEDLTAWCRDVSIEPFVKKDAAQNKRYWIYTANYSSAFELNTNPGLDPPRFNWTTEQFEKEITEDRNGNKIVNTAGDFLKGVVRDDSRLQVEVTVPVLNGVPASVAALMDKLNNAVFIIDGYTAATNTAKFTALKLGQRQERNGTVYRMMSFIVQFRADEWKAFPPNVGMRCVDSVDPTKRCMIVNDGDLTPVTEPVPLSASGTAISNPTGVNAQYIEVDRYYEANFSVLTPYI